ncbi:GYD domain-containing protein [Saccharomonospora halophila]|uniref:GYD domain-containing protein n=1 Tax=Saccharomonospora halophila TaxID=129922 RepID=UPI00039B504C|nr:GYD domain-containing protein [Saccharomonospora halophila]
MATLISLMKWTEQGVRGYRESVDRYENARQLAERYDTELGEFYWTPGGPYDLVAVVRCDDVRKATAFLLAVESMGNLRIEAVHGYGPDEMREVISLGG